LIIFFACLFIASSIPVYAQEGSGTTTMEEVVVTILIGLIMAGTEDAWSDHK